MKAIQHSFDDDKLAKPIGERSTDALRLNFDEKELPFQLDLLFWGKGEAQLCC